MKLFTRTCAKDMKNNNNPKIAPKNK